MAQKITHLYKSPNSTEALNNHIAKIVAEGAYKGLEVVPTDPDSFSVNLTEGYALTDQGVKIEEELPLPEVATFSPPDPNFPRIDLLVLRHRYAKPVNSTLTPNNATYHIIQGIPTPPPANPLPPDQQVFAGGITPPNWLQDGDIILADIHMMPGRTFISEDMIFNRSRTMTTTELMDMVARALYLALGNFVYWGWELTSDWLNVIVAPGEGLLCGRVNKTTSPFAITTLRAREYLFDPIAINGQQRLIMDSVDAPGVEDSHNLGNGYNLTLDRQPDYPSILRITVRPVDCTTSGYVRISGKNENGEYRQESVFINCPVQGEAVTVETAVRFSEVYVDHVDAQGLHRPGKHIEFTIKDKPLAYIYAVGTSAGRAVFKSVYSPTYKPLCNELLLAIAETDEEKVIKIDDMSTDSFGEIEEDLSPQCDGHRMVFVLKNIPLEGSEMVVIDGSVLKRNSINNKGYTIDGAEITLQPGIPTPEGDLTSEAVPPATTVHGFKGTDLWVRYRRRTL